MKGRCIGVSLGLCYIKNKKYKNEKSLPLNYQPLHFYMKKERRETPQYIWKRGSLTIEAAIILPLMACFFAFILFYFRVMQVQIVVQESLERTAEKLAVFSSQMQEEKEEMYLAVTKSLVYFDLKQVPAVENYVNGGALGVSLIMSKFDGDDIVLKANYSMKFPVNLLGKRTFFVSQEAQSRKWTGWHAVGEDMKMGMTVYVTSHGAVYHMRTSCPYLKLSIQPVAEAVISTCRNKDGKKYRACEKCGTETNESKVVYITVYGERYHYEMRCSGLKRTIYQKKLSELGGMEACPKCWK